MRIGKASTPTRWLKRLGEPLIFNLLTLSPSNQYIDRCLRHVFVYFVAPTSLSPLSYPYHTGIVGSNCSLLERVSYDLWLTDWL